MPKSHDFEGVGKTAGHDETSEAPKHPIEWQVFSLTHDVDQRYRDRKVGKSDEAVRNDV
jgi:hypothetical protein